MDRRYSRRMLAMYMLAALFLIGFIGEFRVLDLNFEEIRFGFYTITLFISAALIHWVSAAPEVEAQAGSRQRVERALRHLNDDDLSLLRSRLMQDEREEEYGSMAELVQSGKRKNEMRDI